MEVNKERAATPDNPQLGDLHINTWLTQVSIKYSNPAYIADDLFPPVPVMKQSDIVPVYDQSHWFRDDAQLRAPGGKSVRGGWSVDQSNAYYCPNYAFGHEIPDELRKNADSVFNLDREATEFSTDKLYMRRERAFAGDYMKTSVWGTDKTGGTDFTQWSDYGASSPLVDLTVYKDTVEGLIGREPNVLAMGKQVWVQLKWHPDLVDSIKYTQRGQVSEEIFASLAEFAKVRIGRAIYTTTPEGVAESSVSYTRIWGKDALMLYAPERPSLMTPSAGYTFIWQAVPNALQFILRFRDQERRVDIIECNSYFTQYKTGAAAGLFMHSAVA